MQRSMKFSPNPYDDAEARFRFVPPLCVQRWHHINQLIEACEGHEAFIDIGCGEGEGFSYWMRSQRSLHQTRVVVALDVDESALQQAVKIVPTEPPIVDFFYPCDVLFFVGDVTSVDPTFPVVLRREGIRCGIAMELIEHFPLDKVQDFVNNVFGVWQLRNIIISTPNRDANRMIGLPPGKLRHWDHKQEWTALQFRLWCRNVVVQYPAYDFAITYVGKFKACQVATFTRVSRTNEPSVATEFVAEYKLTNVFEIPCVSALARVAAAVRAVILSLPSTMATNGSFKLSDIVQAQQFMAVLDQLPRNSIPLDVFGKLGEEGSTCAELSAFEIQQLVAAASVTSPFKWHVVEGYVLVVHDVEQDNAEDVQRLSDAYEDSCLNRPCSE
jgi:2-polyprenyl-3-methyl-5-hydroxy-6-metoxy-1,4-benzoquinol methylase